MNCAKARESLSGYLDSGSAIDPQSALGVHLRDCRDCTAFLEEARRADELLRLKTAEQPPGHYWEDYWPRVKSGIEALEGAPEPDIALRRTPLPIPFFARLGLAVNIALAVLLVCAAALMYRNNREIKHLRESLAGAPGAAAQAALSHDPFLASRQLISRQVKLFQEVREVFPENIEWVLTNNGSIDLGISNDRLPGAPDALSAPTMLLHFNIVRTGPSGAEVVSSPTITMLSGQETNASLRGLSDVDKTVYFYRCAPQLLPDGKIEIDASIGIGRAVLRTTVSINAAETVQLGTVRAGDTEYLIYLSAHYEDIAARGQVKMI